MKLERTYFILLFILFFTSILEASGQKTVSSVKEGDSIHTKLSNYNQVQMTINLPNDFEIKVGQREDYDKFETYTLLILTHKNKILFIDSSLTEYEFGDKLYPLVRKLDDNTFEILVEVNDRPSKNRLKYFKVYNDKIISVEKLPTFISKPTNLDIDKNLELAGFWDWPETFGDNSSLSVYSPILYYELSLNGIVLDSTLTIFKNKEIYGEFHGFKYNENVTVKIKEIKKWNDEIDRIIFKE